MEVQIREKDSCSREIFVTVPWVELEGDFEKTVTKFSRSIRLPGFRPGKAPRQMILKNFQHEIEAEFARDATEKFYLKALEVKELKPVNQGKIDHLSFVAGQPLKFTAIFEVIPKFELPNYKKKLALNKNLYIPDEVDVDMFIQDARQEYAELKTVDSGSQEGHLLLVNLQELDSTGIPIVGRKAENKYIKVGEGIFGGENLSSLRGLKAGDQTKIRVPTQAGHQEISFEVVVKNVQEELFPEVDLEFIQKIDKNASSMEEFRKNVSERIRSGLERDSEVLLNEAIIDYFLQNTIVEVPSSMVDQYVESAIADKQRKNGKPVRSEEGKDEKWREGLKASAIRNIKWYMIRKSLIKEENITVSDEQVDHKIQELILSSGDSGKQLQRYYKKPSHQEELKESLLDKKLFDFLKSYAKITDVKVHTRELRERTQESKLYRV